MTYGRVAGLTIKYLPFLGILALKIYSLYHGVTTIADEAKRARAEKICITAAIDFIKNRSDKKCGKCFLKTLKDAIAEVDA